jgi:hypothetical protein
MGYADALIGAGAALIGSAQQASSASETNAANLEIAQMNNAWSAEQYAKRYQTMTADLTKAGLNPMLAYSQSPGSAPSAQQVVFQNPMGGGSPISSAVNAYNQTRGTSAQSSHHEASAEKAKHEVDQVDALTNKIKEETKNVPDQGKQIRQTVQMLADQAALMAQQGESQAKQRQVMSATIQKLNSETDLLKLDAAAAAKFDNLGREAKQYAPIVDLIKEIVRSRR